MLTPPFDHVAFMLTPDLPPSTSKARDDRPPPPRVLALGRAIGMTVDTEGNVWIYIEPADAVHGIAQVGLNSCRRACAAEIYEHDNIRRRTLADLNEHRRAEFDAAAVVTP